MSVKSTAAAIEPEHHSAGRYVLVWVALIILTFSTYAASRFDLGHHWNLFVAVAIAIAKSALVVLFFIHLSEHRGAYRLVFVVSIVFVSLLIGLTTADVATRFPLANPPTGQNANAPAYRHFTDADAVGPKAQPGTP